MPRHRGQSRRDARQGHDNAAACLHHHAAQAGRRDLAVGPAEHHVDLGRARLGVDEHQSGITAGNGATAHEPPGGVRAQARRAGQSSAFVEGITGDLRGHESGAQRSCRADLQRRQALGIGENLGGVTGLRQCLSGILDIGRLRIDEVGVVRAAEVGDRCRTVAVLPGQPGHDRHRRRGQGSVDRPGLRAHRRGGVDRIGGDSPAAGRRRSGQQQPDEHDDHQCGEQGGGNARPTRIGGGRLRIRPWTSTAAAPHRGCRAVGEVGHEGLGHDRSPTS